VSDLALVVEIQTVPGERETFLARLGKHRANVLANEPGCRRFDILVPQDEEDGVILCEVYADAKALEDHDAAPYFQAYRADTAAMMLCTLLSA
jgi:quinol monooxygenase YgiN